MKFSPLQKLNVLVFVLALFVLFVPKFSFAASKLVIDEFQIGKTGASNEDYVTIANYGDIDVKLDGYSLIRKNSDGSTTSNLYIFSKTANYYIKKGLKLKIANKLYTGTFDLRYSNSSSYISTDDILVLKNGTTIIDTVGFNNAEEYEGNPVPNVRPDVFYVRKEGVDTDNNENDFVSSVKTVPVVIDLNANKVVISELLPNPDGGEEWFELYNPTNLGISLANLKICDALGARHCYFFNKVDTLLAGAYKTYTQSITKITLNNDGDWLELYDMSDNLLTDTGGNYGVADKGVSLALFGTDYQWTKSLTPAAQNIFTDTIEVEADTELPATKAKAKVSVAKKAVVSATATTVAADATPGVAVKAAETVKAPATVAGVPISRKTLGWALICLAILLVLGYTLWYFRSYAKDIYDKIRHGDDSARF